MQDIAISDLENNGYMVTFCKLKWYTIRSCWNSTAFDQCYFIL